MPQDYITTFHKGILTIKTHLFSGVFIVNWITKGDIDFKVFWSSGRPLLCFSRF